MTGPGLWVPPAADPLRDTRRQVDAERAAFVEHMRGLLPETRRLNGELRRVDPYLELVFVAERAPDDDPAMIPGCWHLVRHNPDASDTWMPIHDGDGGYVDPRDAASRVFDKLAEGNMWNASHLQRQRKREARRAAEREREKERQRQERVDEANERWAAASQVRISFSPEHRWTQNTGGRRGANRGG